MTDLPGVPEMPAPAPGTQPGLAGADPRLGRVAELGARLLPRLQAYAHKVRFAVRLLALLVVGTAVVAIGLATAAWKDEPIGIVIVVVACLPALIGAVRLARRVGALAMSVAQADRWKAEFTQLGSGVADSTELSELQAFLQRDEEGGGGGGAISKLRTYRKLTRLAGNMVERATPSKESSPLLQPLVPGELARTWGALMMALWGWLLAGISVLVAGGALAASAV